MVYDEPWYDDFNFTGDKNTGWRIQRAIQGEEDWSYSELNDIKYEWNPVTSGHLNITFWGPFYYTEADQVVFISRMFRCFSAARSISVRWKTAACNYKSNQDNVKFYVETQHTDGLELFLDDDLKDGDDGIVNGSAKSGYEMSDSFGRDSNGYTLNEICQSYTDLSQRYWVQEWGYVFSENLEKNEDFLVAIRIDTSSIYNNIAMIFDISVDCNISPTEDPTPAPTPLPTSVPASNPTIVPTFNPTTIPTVDPTIDPTSNPTSNPTTEPTTNPTINPTANPSSDPSNDPTTDPIMSPTFDPTKNPTVDPTKQPTNDPSSIPTKQPTNNPSPEPTEQPVAPNKAVVTTQVNASSFKYAYYEALAVVIIVSMTVCIFGHIDAKFVRENDYYQVSRLGATIFQFLDLFTDIFLAMEISRRMRDQYFLALLILSLVFIVGPIIVSFVQLLQHLRKSWWKDANLSIWLEKHENILYLCSILLGSTFTSIPLTNSNLFQLKAFSMGLTNRQYINYQVKRIYSIVLFQVTY